MSRMICLSFLLTSLLSQFLPSNSLAQEPLNVGFVAPYSSESPHPYPAASAERQVVWEEMVVFSGAKFLRVHFVNLLLASGDYLTVSNPDGSQIWTYTGRGPQDNGDVWASAIDGEEAVVHIYGGSSPGYGYRIDAVGHGTVDLNYPGAPPPLVCGSDGRENVICHVPGPDTTFADSEGPVARLSFVSFGRLEVCTGWLIRATRDNTLITNNHCISAQTQVDSLDATFNFQTVNCDGSGGYPERLTVRGNTLLDHNANLDYALLTLRGNAQATYGVVIGTTKAVAVGDVIWIPQHPRGGPKKVGWFEDAEHTIRCTVMGTMNDSITYTCDTDQGSSGAPVEIAANGHAIGLHSRATPGATGGAPPVCPNIGYRLSAICARDAGANLNCAND